MYRCLCSAFPTEVRLTTDASCEAEDLIRMHYHSTFQTTDSTVALSEMLCICDDAKVAAMPTAVGSPYLNVWQVSNFRNGITGLLVYDQEKQLIDGILEGPAKVVMSLFGSINADPRHEVDTYRATSITFRQYGGWSMALVAQRMRGMLMPSSRRASAPIDGIVKEDRDIDDDVCSIEPQPLNMSMAEPRCAKCTH